MWLMARLILQKLVKVVQKVITSNVITSMICLYSQIVHFLQEVIKQKTRRLMNPKKQRFTYQRSVQFVIVR